MMKPVRCQVSDDDVTPRGSPSQYGSSDGTASPYGYRGGKREAPPYREPPGPASPPQRSLPPYRDPPPPLSSPPRPSPSQPSPPSSAGKLKTKRNLLKVCKIILHKLMLLWIKVNEIRILKNPLFDSSMWLSYHKIWDFVIRK